MSNAPLLHATNVEKRFGSYRVFQPQSFSLSRGRIILLTGANGSGKSTLLRILAGLMTASSGTVNSHGNKVSYHAHDSMLYDHLTVKENLTFFLTLFRATQSIDELAARWGLERQLGRRVATLSQGQKARVSLCRALHSGTDIVLLDEPTASLDDASKDILTARLKELKEDGTGTLITTHYPQHYHQLADEHVTL